MRENGKESNSSREGGDFRLKMVCLAKEHPALILLALHSPAGKCWVFGFPRQRSVRKGPRLPERTSPLEERGQLGEILSDHTKLTVSGSQRFRVPSTSM